MENNDLLKKVADYLVINGSFTDSISLMHGKMGIILFFYHYARYSKNPIYEEYAGHLIGEIYEDLFLDIPVDFENGLCGIGWGIEYLVHHHFVDGDTSEILEDVDLRMMERDPKRIKDLSFQTGLAGIGYYVACHIKSKEMNTTVFDSFYLKDLEYAMNQVDWNNEPSLSPSIRNFYKNNSPLQTLSEEMSLNKFLNTNKVELSLESPLNEIPVGINNGLAGVGLKLMNV